MGDKVLSLNSAQAGPIVGISEGTSVLGAEVAFSPIKLDPPLALTLRGRYLTSLSPAPVQGQDLMGYSFSRYGVYAAASYQLKLFEGDTFTWRVNSTFGIGPQWQTHTPQLLSDEEGLKNACNGYEDAGAVVPGTDCGNLKEAEPYRGPEKTDVIFGVTAGAGVGLKVKVNDNFTITSDVAGVVGNSHNGDQPLLGVVFLVGMGG